MFCFVKVIVTWKVKSIPRLLHSAILIFSVAVVANAQGVGSSRGLASGDGIHTIQGRVYLPAGQPTRAADTLSVCNDSDGENQNG